MAKDPRQPDSLLAWMDSLADETRLRLLHLLERQELGVVELCDILQLPQSTVSRHLKVLADQKWVRSRRLATTRFYRTIIDELEPAARKLWILARDQTQDWATLHQDELRLKRRLRQREIDSQEFFASAASEWDQLRRELYGESFSIAAMLALLPREMIVADLGCGTGSVIERLAPHVERVIGVDSNNAMLKFARRRLSALRNVELRRGDLQALPVEDSSCHAALLLLVLTYAPDVPAVIHEAARIVRPGGRVIVVDLLPHDRDDFRRQLGQLHPGFEPTRIVQALKEAGLTNAICRPLPPEPTAKGPAMFLATASKQ